MTTEFGPTDLIDRDKTHLSAVDEEAERLADALEAHPAAANVTDADTAGDIVFTTPRGTWALNFQPGPDGEVFQNPAGTTPAPTDTPADTAIAAVLRDVVVPALLAHPAYQAATADSDTLTVHLATGRHYTLALTPAT